MTHLLRVLHHGTLALHAHHSLVVYAFVVVAWHPLHLIFVSHLPLDGLEALMDRADLHVALPLGVLLAVQAGQRLKEVEMVYVVDDDGLARWTRTQLPWAAARRRLRLNRVVPLVHVRHLDSSPHELVDYVTARQLHASLVEVDWLGRHPLLILRHLVHLH